MMEAQEQIGQVVGIGEYSVNQPMELIKKSLENVFFFVIY